MASPTMEQLESHLKRARIIPLLTGLLSVDLPCYLVGGAVRDLLDGRLIKDFDFATPRDPTRLAQAFSRAVGGSWFMLDAERRQSRVIWKAKEAEYCYDFAPFRGLNLDGDLRGRDFTVNALAVGLPPEGPEAGILDPLGGRKDLSERVLRPCSRHAFHDDPLRVLRGIRLAVTLDLKPDRTAMAGMTAAVSLVANCAAERIRDEIAGIFNAPRFSQGIALMQGLGFIERFFGSGNPDAGRKVSKLVIRFVEGLISTSSGSALEPVVKKDMGDGFTRMGLLKFAGFLRGLAPVELQTLLSSRLRLSARNMAIVQDLIKLPECRGTELLRLQTTQRGLALWAQALGCSSVDSLLFLPAIAADLQTRPEAVLNALKACGECSEGGRVPDLVSGTWISDNLKIPSGPEVGLLLGKLRKEEIAGRIRTREEALVFLSSMAEKIIDKG